jgi:hypothetical protein
MRLRGNETSAGGKRDLIGATRGSPRADGSIGAMPRSAYAPSSRGGGRFPGTVTVKDMGIFSRRVDAVVVALSWKRTVVIEQGRWESRRTTWKPHGDNVRNVRTVQATEPDTVFDLDASAANGDIPLTKARAVLAKHTYFEYEEFGWHRYRSFSARGEGPADVGWPAYTLGPDQRVSEQREAYRAKFSAGAGGGAEYVTELDEATWRTLDVGTRCRLTVGAFSDQVKQVAPGPAAARLPDDGPNVGGLR